jgi:hypothetical protein
MNIKFFFHRQVKLRVIGGIPLTYYLSLILLKPKTLTNFIIFTPGNPEMMLFLIPYVVSYNFNISRTNRNRIVSV